MRRGGIQWLVLGCGVAGCASAPPRTGVPDLPVAASHPADEPFRAAPPPSEPQRTFHPPEVQESTLPNGMRLLVIERHTLRLVAAELVVRGGFTGFPQETPAAMELMAGLTLHGTKSFTEAQIFSEMNARLIALDPHVGDSAFGVSMRAPSRWFERGLQMMRSLALEPTFPPREFEIARKRAVGLALLNHENADVIARRNLFAAAYGPTHPYARAFAPEGDDLAKATRDDLVRIWREMMDPSDAILVVAGDVDPGEVRRVTEAAFAGWRHDPKFVRPAPAPPPAPGQARVVVVDRPGAHQATVLYGALAPGMKSPDHPADLLLREMIGGMRSSALATELRDELGATWHEGVAASIRQTSGLDWWYGSVAPGQTAAALKALDSRMRELRVRGPSADELAAAKGSLVHAFPLWFETVKQLADHYAQGFSVDLAVDEVERTMARVKEISADEVRAAVPDASAVKVVVVGDLASLQDSLLRLGWGPIQVNDVDGHPVRTLGIASER